MMKLQLCRGRVRFVANFFSLGSSFLKLQYVHKSVFRSMRIGRVKIMGSVCHKNFSWCEKYAILLRHGFENGCVKGMHKGQIILVKNIASCGMGT